MKITMNETRKQIIETLKIAEKPLTLREIAKRLNVEKINSGTTNPLVSSGILKDCGEVEIVCPCCGKKDKIKSYAIGDLSILENQDKQVKK